MKGIVFTEFLEMVEEGFGYEMVDKLLTESDLPSKGIYSAVGTYPHSEIITLVVNLHKNTQIPLSQLLEAFGEYLFNSLMKAYGHIFQNVNDAFAMLSSIETYIHVQVKKLYPDAQLPTFKVETISENQIIMYYTSERSMGDLAIGLINGCLKHYNESAEIVKEDLNESGSNVKFVITKK
ncbi:hypothetical protein EGI22_02005 [Lacihabitans sp. LS3-19]|uniref:heme NO-binding domain-containing protein n=1 Tax=Lacihabitans sp. LS3-19 TaxID=2487335 RepID=UPI0020CD1666|nr:heme NO-binding domain-containing protein [Lacihabitans sp. LS3-19]MCP9766664.1 hypothetical protein [Lacihabitans sp. LS3-19]